jgi:hypothetical protein
MFLFNPDIVFSVGEVADRTAVHARVVDREMATLQKAGMIRRKPFPKNGGVGGNKIRGNGWTLNRGFKYLKPMENLLIQQVLISEGDIVRRLEKVGKIKLLVISGLFIQDPESRVDLLMVCEHLKKKSLTQVIKDFEAEIGKELRYTAFEIPEFEYRVKMYDKLVRDIFDFPHRKIVDKIGVMAG